jgi:hypothetical protein
MLMILIAYGEFWLLRIKNGVTHDNSLHLNPRKMLEFPTYFLYKSEADRPE